MYIIGTINKPTGVMLTDSEGNEYLETKPTPGFHVNSDKALAGCEAYEVTPVTPQAVYVGAAKTYFYTFADEAEFLSICPLEEV